MWCTDLAALLARMEQQGRSGEVDWRPPLASGPALCKMDPALDRLFDHAWRQGIPLASSIAALRVALGDAADLKRGVRGLQLLFRLRVAIAVTAAIAIRLAILREGILSFISPRDRSAVVLAVALMVAASVLLHSVLPEPWLGRTKLRQLAYTWLHSHLEGDAQPGGPMEAELRQLRQRELRLGIGLQREKRQLLEQWCKEEIERGKRHLRRWEDLLPLWELIGVGIPMVLVMIELIGQVLEL